MKEKINKEAWANLQLEKHKMEILKLFSEAPKFGVTSLAVHFMEGSVKRIVHMREESIVPEKNENR